MLKKGWFSAGVNHLKTAVELNPNNEEYRETIQLLSRKVSQIRANYARVAAQNNSQNDMDLCGGGAGPGMSNGGDMCGGNQANAANILNSMSGNGNPLAGGGNPLGGGNNPLGGNMQNGNPLQSMLMQNLMSPNNMNMCGNGGGGMC